MARSECICHDFSCEPVTEKIGDQQYQVSTSRRFRFEKEEGVIVNGGIVPNDILHCEIKPRVEYKDKQGFHEPKNNYCDKGGHKERSLAHDDRKHGHKDHWKKQNKNGRTNL